MPNVNILVRALSLLALLAGCSALPAEGPSTADIVEQQESQDYVLIQFDKAISELLSRYRGSGLAQRFPTVSSAPPTNTVGVGDELAIRILEAGATGLFTYGADGGRGGTFPSVTVDTSGAITLPYVGRLPVAGLSPARIESSIADALEGRAIEPQASVTIVNSLSNMVTVTGDVQRPGKYPLSLRPVPLAQAIAVAGGSRHQDFETRVTVVRNGGRASATLDRVLLEPRQNIALQRDDMVVLSHAPAQYTITGAVMRSGTFPLETADVSLLEAVSGAGGLVDARADPGGVFVFRFEFASILRKAGIGDLERFGADATKIPTVYWVNFRDVTARFHSQNFKLRDSDAVYVSNSETTQASKILAIVGSWFSTVNAGLSINQN